MLSNKTPYGKQGANKYYAGYLSGGFRPLNIVIKDKSYVLITCMF